MTAEREDGHVTEEEVEAHADALDERVVGGGCTETMEAVQELQEEEAEAGERGR